MNKKHQNCPFCNTDLLWEGDRVLKKGQYCTLIVSNSQSIKGSMYIVTNEHKTSPFELSDEEILETNQFIKIAKQQMDQSLNCDGHNLGWNVGEVGGQALEHVHLHIIPRYQNEQFAGKGIRHWFKLEENRRSIQTP